MGQIERSEALEALDELVYDPDCVKVSSREARAESIRRVLSAYASEALREAVTDVLDYIGSKSPRNRQQVAVAWIHRRLREGLKSCVDMADPANSAECPACAKEQSGVVSGGTPHTCIDREES